MENLYKQNFKVSKATRRICEVEGQEMVSISERISESPTRRSIIFRSPSQGRFCNSERSRRSESINQLP